MGRVSPRKVFALSAWPLAAWLGMGLGQARAEAELSVQLTCPERQGSGRVVCEVSVSGVPPHSELVWADALVVKTPAFVKPLRARVAAPAFARGAQSGKWPVAFVAEEVGHADVTVRGRAVVCTEGDGPRHCHAGERTVSAEIVVRR